MKHSKKLAFAVLVAIAAVGATVAPVNAESGVYGDNNTVDGYNAIAVGTGNTVNESTSTSAIVTMKMNLIVQR